LVKDVSNFFIKLFVFCLADSLEFLEHVLQEVSNIFWIIVFIETFLDLLLLSICCLCFLFSNGNLLDDLLFALQLLTGGVKSLRILLLQPQIGKSDTLLRQEKLQLAIQFDLQLWVIGLHK